MGTFGPNSGATFANDAGVGSVALSDPANAAASDDSYVTAVLALGQTCQYLKATGFGFAIPLDATIRGVSVGIERGSTVGSAVSDFSVRLVKGGTITGDNKATGSNWDMADTTATYGGAADLWGVSLTPADINAATFGVVVAATTALAATMNIDHVHLTVTYHGSNRAVTWPRVAVGDGMARGDRV